MMDFIIGMILTLASIALFQLLGIAITQNKKSYSYSFFVGYIFYSFAVAVFGIIIQILNLSWYLFFGCMISILLGCILFIVFAFKKHRIEINIHAYIKENWFIYVSVIVLVGFALTHVPILWNNNMSDDAYYLTKMASMPYMNQPFRSDYTTGLYEAKLTSYVLNTFELEASFYLFITKMNAAMYARIFLSALNYFIILQSIKAFFEKLEINIDLNKLQYIIVLLFFIFALSTTVFISTDAQWTILSAAYYGSALTRIVGPFMVLIPIINKTKLTLSDCCFVFMICVVLVSKSTIVVPLLFVLCVGYLVSLLAKKNTKSIMILALLIIFLVLIGFLLPDKELINQSAFDNLAINFKKPFTLLTFIFLICLSYKNKTIRSLLFIIVTAFSLILIPELNDIQENFSVYNFVTIRMIYTLFIFTFICTIGFLLCLFFSKFTSRVFVGAFNCIACMIVLLVSILTDYEYTKPMSALRLLPHNYNTTPQSTVMLGEALETYCIENNTELHMIMTPGLFVDGMEHFSSQIIRAFSPHTISITGGLRVNEEIDIDSPYKGYDLNDISALDSFLVDPNEQTLNKVQELCQEFPIDCIVGSNVTDVHTKYLESIGFNLYTEVIDQVTDPSLQYAIYIKN